PSVASRDIATSPRAAPAMAARRVNAIIYKAPATGSQATPTVRADVGVEIVAGWHDSQGTAKASFSNIWLQSMGGAPTSLVGVFDHTVRYVPRSQSPLADLRRAFDGLCLAHRVRSDVHFDHRYSLGPCRVQHRGLYLLSLRQRGDQPLRADGT